MKDNINELISDYLLINYSKPLSVDQICQALDINRSKLYRHVKNRTGLSPKEFLTRLRMQQAGKLMADTRLPVKEIAPLCGYKESHLFSKAFKNFYGINARTYRTLSGLGMLPSNPDRQKDRK